MIVVHEPSMSVRDGVTRVAARVEIGRNAGQTLWFEAEDEAGSFLTTRGDAFAAALLPVASALSQPLEVRGAVSPRLAWGLRELVHLHRVWWPRNSSRVEFRFPRLEAPATGQRAVGCSFSGGVDSLFTAFRHLPRNEAIPELRITHLVVINGFDHDQHLDEPTWFGALRAIYGPVAEQEGLRLAVVRTNMSDLMGMKFPVDWHRWLGTLIAAPALALGGGLARHYIGAAEGYGQLTRFGSSPLSDPWISTESLHVVHDGPEATRVEKLETIATWPETWDRLRVCRSAHWTSIDVDRQRVQNCGRCEKCVRTMVALRLIGKLDRFTTFRRPLTMRAVLTARLGRTSIFYVRENVRLALRTRHYRLAVMLLASLIAESCRRLATPVTGIARRIRRRAPGVRDRAI